MNHASPTPLATALGDLAVKLHASGTPEATAHTIVMAATTIIPGIGWAGVSLARGETVTPVAPTDDVARDLNQLQGDLSEGPTLDVLIEQRTVVIPDLSAETRWPRFVAAATTRGVQCMAAFRLFVTQGNVGVLTLYGPRPHLFDDDAVLHGEILAQHAAVALAGARAQEQLHRAIASRDVIGQAKGIIMERFGVTAVRAFEMLTQLSQERNVKLVNVAQQVVDSTGTA